MCQFSFYSNQSRMAPPVAVTLSLLLLSFITIFNCLEFQPVTENVSLKAIYQLQTFVNREPHSVSEIHEHYHHNLASSNIWLRRHVNGLDSSPVKRYLYNGELRRDVELVGEHDPGQLYLYQSGSDPSATGEEGRLKRVKSAIYLYGDKAQGSSSEPNSLDFVMYKLHTNSKKFNLNLDLFLEKGCREKMDEKLHYVRGLTRLLEMIECRRTAFKLDAALMSASHLTRGVGKAVYSVKDLPAITDNTDTSLVRFLNVTLSVENHKTITELVLPARSIPLSMSLEFGDDQLQVLMIINVFQFETVPLNEHLMTWESLYLLPKASGLDDMLASDYAPGRQQQPQPQQIYDDNRRRRSFPSSFSFTASLTGSHLKIGQDPIELSVVYDVKTRVLARQLSLIDRGQVVGDSYRRHVSRLVYDHPSKYKFHIKHQNNDYFYSEQQQQNEDDYYWRQCASNLIVDSELVKLETGGSRLFNLDKAVYLGRDRIRGIICNVYELRSYGLPIWMGWEDFENYYWIKSDMHATVYEAANYVLDTSYGQGLNDSSYATDGKIVRMQINLIPHDSSAQQGDIMSYTLDMHHFEWEVSSDLRGLMNIGQDCFLSSSSVRHLDMSVALEPLKVDPYWSKLSYELAHSLERRQETVAKLLNRKPFHISPIQQIDLKTSIAHGGELLEAQLAVYEQPQNQLRFKYLGFAEDLSLGSAQANSWQQGATSISLQECNWRAAHTLRAEAYTSTYRGPSSEQRRLLMYCAHSFHCVLDLDSAWMQADDKLKSVASLFKYPVSSDHPNRCALIEIWIDPMIGSPHLPGPTATRPLEWLLKVEAEQIDLQEAVELEVEQDGSSSLVLKVAKLEMSHIVQPDGQETGGALRGLGYFCEQDCSKQVKVSSFAQCSHQCLMSAHCRSYSLCHHHGHLNCLLTRVNWTEPVKIEELKSLVHVLLGSNRRPTIEVRLEDGVGEKVILNRSPLCSIYQRKHLELFKFRNSSLILMAPANQLLNVPSPDLCARHCLYRVKMMSNLNPKATEMKEDTKEKEEEEEEEDTCLLFRFSRSLNLCELLPGRPLPLEVREKISGPDLSWSQKLPRFDEMETYELQYELLFDPRPDLRLVLEGRGVEAREEQQQLQDEVEEANEEDGEEEDSSWRWQMTVARACSAQVCARYCLMNPNCRSFDMLAPFKSGQLTRELTSNGGACHFGELCVLNGLALDDIRNRLPLQQHHGFALKREPPSQTTCKVEATVGVKGGQSNRWWHYEPSQLAQFAAFAGRQRSRQRSRYRHQATDAKPVAPAAIDDDNVHEVNGGEHSEQTTRGIFISPGTGAMAAGGHHEHGKLVGDEPTGGNDATRQVSQRWPTLLLVVATCLLLAC